MPFQLSLFDAETPTDGLFFAHFPDSDTAASIFHAADRLRLGHGLKGWPFRPERLHVSLIGFGVFAGFPPRLVFRAREAASAIAFAPFEVMFDRVVSFDGKKRAMGFVGKKWPLVLCGGSGLANLIAFQRVLADAIQSVGFGSVKTHFRPHVTLLYDNCVVHEQPIESISWTVREFVLIHSLRGKSQYIPLGRWSLH